MSQHTTTLKFSILKRNIYRPHLTHTVLTVRYGQIIKAYITPNFLQHDVQILQRSPFEIRLPPDKIVN